MLKKVHDVVVDTNSFMKKAWKATGADKVLNALNTVLAIHNAVMLSKQLGVTIGEVTSLALNALGIRDEGNNLIDVNGVIKAKLDQLLTGLLGAEGYDTLTQKIAQANRIYQTGANVADALSELIDNSREIVEASAEYTGKIGKALLDSAVVLEDSYDQMIDSFTATSRNGNNLAKFRSRLEQIEGTVDTVERIASDVVQTTQSVAEIQEAKREWNEANEGFLTNKENEKTNTKNNSKVETELDYIDFTSDEPQ